MPLKFCANLNFLFTENGVGLLERYRLAQKAGFKGVESPFPSGIALEEVVKVKNETGLEQVLLNISTEGIDPTLNGCSANPFTTQEFQKNLNETVQLAKMLNCKKIHVMAGKTVTDPEEQMKTYLSNLKQAAKVFEKEGIIGLIEPINNYSVPGYFLNSYPQAIKVLDEINSPNLKLMVDIFHLQHLHGNVTNILKEVKSYIGHVQIAQVPHRHEPDVSGELDYSYVFQALECNGYKGWVGCEYKPKAGSAEGLGWVKRFGYDL